MRILEIACFFVRASARASVCLRAFVRVLLPLYCMCVRAHARTSIFTACVFVCVSNCVRVRVHARICVHTFVCKYVYRALCTRVCVHACTCVFVCLLVFIHCTHVCTDGRAPMYLPAYARWKVVICTWTRRRSQPYWNHRDRCSRYSLHSILEKQLFA